MVLSKKKIYIFVYAIQIKNSTTFSINVVKKVWCSIGEITYVNLIYCLVLAYRNFLYLYTFCFLNLNSIKYNFIMHKVFKNIQNI